LGLPVVPEVKWSSAMSSGRVCTVSKLSVAAAIAGPSGTQPSGASSSSTSTSFSEGNSARQGATLRR
jgi:hypothetical protein